jgi:hypothetical protein
VGTNMSMEADLLQKVKEWKEKANSESDPFDKYLSMFIAYNIFYNLYERKRTNDMEIDFSDGDSRRAIDVVQLTNPTELFDEISNELGLYLKIIPVFREEYWPRKILRDGSQGLPIADSLKVAFRENAKNEVVELLFKWLYKIRCNLVHGVKSYKDTDQGKLLRMSSQLLDRILDHLLARYEEKFNT